MCKRSPCRELFTGGGVTARFTDARKEIPRGPVRGYARSASASRGGRRLVVRDDTMIAAGPAGLTLWPDVSLAPAPVSDPALGPAGVVYWLDGAQAPQMRVLTG